MVAGSKRRQVDSVQPLTWTKIENQLTVIDDPRAQCLIALLYLSGRRINEVLHLQKKDFKVEPNRISFETFNEKVYRKKPTGDFQIPRNGRYYERIHPHWRTDTDSGESLTVFLIQTLDSLPKPTDYLFPRLKGVGHIHCNMAYKIVRFYFPDAWPHLFRHERFTEVAKAYQQDPVAMHRFTFHKRFESTLQYIRNLEEEKI